MILKNVIKYILMFCFVLSYLFINPINSLLSKEINLIYTSRFFARSLYQDDIFVSSNPLPVMDYFFENQKLYIFPLGEEVCLPIDVMIMKVEDNYIEVIDYNNRYKISNINNRRKNLYQYIYANNEFARTESFYLVEGDNLERIVERLVIHYEKV